MKFDAKQIFLYVLTPALITGLFSIAPKAYEIMIEPKASLVYSIARGPQIKVDGTQQQIILVRIANTGKKALNLVRAKLSIRNGNVVAHTLTNANGLSLQEKKVADGLVVTASKVHPSESFSVSVLLKSSNQAIEPSFLLRSDEILGIADTPRPEHEGLDLILLSAGLSSMSVGVMSLLNLRRLRKKVDDILNDILISGGSVLFKADIIYYIAVLACISSNSSESFGDNLTYMRFADMLLELGMTGDRDRRQRAISGLKSLLLVKDMMEQSRAVIERNLRALLGDMYDERKIQNVKESAISSSKIIELRNLIDKMWEGTHSY